MTSHDQLWKDLFRIFFPDLLFLLDSGLASHLVGILGPRGFTFLDKEVFHDLPEGERREVDLLAEIPDPVTGRRFRIHVEIEGSFSGKIARRVARYSHHLYLRHPGPVVSIVVFLHGGPSGVRWTDYVERAFEREIHRFNYLSFGLTAPVGEVERFLLVNGVETYLQLAGRDAEEYAALRLAEETPEVEAMETTWAERQAAEYQKKFFEEGIEKGVERLRSTLLRLLGQRFGPVSPVIRGRVEAIDSLDELGGLVDRILEVRSVDELGLGN